MRTRGSFSVDVVAFVFALDIFISDTHFSALGPLTAMHFQTTPNVGRAQDSPEATGHPV
jgi:hypothetical protein